MILPSPFDLGHGKPWCIAHRGYSALYPENSYCAFDAALEQGAQAMELDVRPSREGVPVIFHDEGLEKVGGKPGLFVTQPLAALQGLDYGAWHSARFRGQELPLLDDVLCRYGKRCYLLVEIKSDEASGDRAQREALMAATLAAVERQQLLQRTFVLCFDLELLAHGRHLNPEARFVLNQDHGCIQRGADFLYAYSVAIEGLEPDFARSVQQLDKPVFTYTCNSRQAFDKAIACGANGIMADDPKLLTERLLALKASRRTD